MVATVVIGKSQHSPGVAVRILSLSDKEKTKFEEEIKSDSLRQKVINDWALLQSYNIPKSADEMLFKLSRNENLPGEVWTWLGCYRSAMFANNSRGGTYVGAGVLALNKDYRPSETVTYITKMLDELLQKSVSEGFVTESIFGFREDEFRTLSRNIDASAEERVGGGINANASSRIYIDLSDLTEKTDFDNELFRIIHEAQKGIVFGEFGELSIGNQQRLASSAQNSHACHFHKVLCQNEDYAPVYIRGDSKPRVNEGQRLSRDDSLKEIEQVSPGLAVSPGTTDPDRVVREIQNLALRMEKSFSRIEDLQNTFERRGVLRAETLNKIISILIVFVFSTFLLVCFSAFWLSRRF